MSQEMPGGFVYIVRAGDTLGNIAVRFGVTVADILRANPSITDPNQIFVGQQILIPRMGPGPDMGGFIHVIQAGETIWGLAQRFGVSVDAILAANPGIDPDRLTVGQRIRIPGAQVPPIPLPTPGFYHVVQPGDTIWNLSIRYGVPMAEILRLNPNVNPNQLQVGQRLFIPERPR